MTIESSQLQSIIFQIFKPSIAVALDKVPILFSVTVSILVELVDPLAPHTLREASTEMISEPLHGTGDTLLSDYQHD